MLSVRTHIGMRRVYQYLAQGRWFRYNNHGCVRLGTYDYYLDYHYDKQTMEITFDASQVAFVCQPEVSMPPIVVAARGLTKSDLMGDLCTGYLDHPLKNTPL